MRFIPSRLSGAFIVEADPHEDERGFLARVYCEREFENHALNTRWVQHNLTHTRKRGTVRGLHFQAAPCSETKLVRCLAGRVWDVIVDIRCDSPSFGQWEAFELSPGTVRATYAPAGFAHGFQCLEDRCDMLYLMSDPYEPGHARGIRWDDPDIGIAWPLPVCHLSSKDRSLPSLADLALQGRASS